MAHPTSTLKKWLFPLVVCPSNQRSNAAARNSSFRSPFLLPAVPAALLPQQSQSRLPPPGGSHHHRTAVLLAQQQQAAAGERKSSSHREKLKKGCHPAPGSHCAEASCFFFCPTSSTPLSSSCSCSSLSARMRSSKFKVMMRERAALPPPSRAFLLLGCSCWLLLHC